MRPEIMKAVLLTGHGGLDKLEHRDYVMRPKPGPDEVLIEVGACGINNTDIWTREGAYGLDDDPDAVSGWRREPFHFPRIQGADTAGRIVEAGIARVVVGVEDPNPLVNGGGIRYLRRHGVHVDVGVCRAEAARLNQAFFTLIGKHRPFVTLKVATSLDGRIAATSGRRTQLTSAQANRQVHLLRAEVDAIAVGSGTVLADNPLLTARGVHRSRPLTRVLFDTRLLTPPAARVLSTLDAGPVIIVTTEAGLIAAPDRAEALRSAGATLEGLEARDLKAALVRLGSRGISSLLLEGGATLHRAAWDAGVVDRVQVYVAPVTLGAQGLPWLTGHRFSLAALHDVRIQSCGPDVLMEGYVYGAD
ncbi:MAG: bifunctional diaminohydroxyphosphoribosylaminopyrimidine deaminase/5-amino-6-(5-phosphoribosylamino)uracil reductase RibD [Planctomycetes bacterium]|nr:bifunctional diaminohydroxyphosphoribosylaminopyrimidine deaminase/5-amino-6-(5-phosphoribosylamino)uracil reductase RibD [Planctomycetota bacterium]